MVGPNRFIMLVVDKPLSTSDRVDLSASEEAMFLPIPKHSSDF
jgi:hypothetical protein